MRKIIIVILILIGQCNFLYCQIIVTYAGVGESGYSGDGGEAYAARLDRPTAVKGDNSGNIYFVDSGNDVIRRINPAGIITTVAGNGTNGYSGDGGPATNATLNDPTDIAFDGDGNMYISEAGNNTIRKVSLTGVINTIAGDGTIGYSGDGGLAILAKLRDPFGMVFDRKGNLIFSDGYNHCIRSINESGIITTIAGTGISGYSGDGGAATNAQFKVPCYLAINKIGEIFIPDWSSNRLRKIDTFGVITTIAGDGTPSNSGDGSMATNSSLHSPEAVVIDDTGNLIVSCLFGYKIRKIDTSGIITTIAGTGVAGFSGDNGPATAAQFNQEALCTYVDYLGNLYITDRENLRIRRINYNTSAVKDVAYSPINVNIAPNPASNEIAITADIVLKDIAVVNVLGQTVFETSGSKKERVIDISFLSPGLYTVKVNNAYAGRFVKE